MDAEITSIVISIDLTDAHGKKSRLQVDVDEELMAAIRQLARLRGCPQGDVVNMALRQFFTAPIGDPRFKVKKANP